jgi:GTPase
VFTLPS